MIRLTIAIPTFNRPVPLARTLTSLLPQLGPATELVVLDNDSEIAAETVLAPLLALHPEATVSVTRHRFNIGGNANIIRCLEAGRGEWLWILGDDDYPAPDAVGVILAAITRQPQADYLNFCTSLWPNRAAYTVANLDQFLDRCDSLSNTFFISAGVYRRARFRHYIQAALAYNHSSVPQLALLLARLRDGGTLAFEAEFTVGWKQIDPAHHWPAYLPFYFYEVAEVLPTHVQQAKLARLIAEQHDVMLGSLSYHLRWALLSQHYHPDNPSALLFFAKAAWQRAALADTMAARWHWGWFSRLALFLHHHPGWAHFLVAHLWPAWHRLRHGRALPAQPLPSGFRGQYLHPRDLAPPAP
jgi:glycosyltransferase involved in cell wall biosynthesis